MDRDHVVAVGHFVRDTKEHPLRGGSAAVPMIRQAFRRCHPALLSSLTPPLLVHAAVDRFLARDLAEAREMQLRSLLVQGCVRYGVDAFLDACEQRDDAGGAVHDAAGLFFHALSAGNSPEALLQWLRERSDDPRLRDVAFVDRGGQGCNRPASATKACGIAPPPRGGCTLAWGFLSRTGKRIPTSGCNSPGDSAVPTGSKPPVAPSKPTPPSSSSGSSLTSSKSATKPPEVESPVQLDTGVQDSSESGGALSAELEERIRREEKPEDGILDDELAEDLRTFPRHALALAERLNESAKRMFASGELLAARKEWERALACRLAASPGVVAKVSEPTAAKEVEVDKTAQIALRTNLALCYYKLDRHDRAVRHASGAITLDRSNAKAWFRLGLAREGLGNLSEALADLEQAAKLAPDDKVVARALSRLQEINRPPCESEDLHECGKTLLCSKTDPLRVDVTSLGKGGVAQTAEAFDMSRVTTCLRTSG